jgi:hypothetical protein
MSSSSPWICNERDTSHRARERERERERERLGRNLEEGVSLFGSVWEEFQWEASERGSRRHVHHVT